MAIFMIDSAECLFSDLTKNFFYSLSCDSDWESGSRQKGCFFGGDYDINLAGTNFLFLFPDKFDIFNTF